MTGTVQDSAGATVPGAEVKAINTGTGLSRSTTTAADGRYVLTELPVGPYQLEVSKDGFSKYVQTGIVLQVASNPTIDIALKVGAVSEQVQVEANAAMVETQNSGVGTVIDSQRVLDLPLVGRQIQDLITLAGGASQGSDTSLLSARNYPGIQAISVAGGLANGVTYVLDGASHQDVYTMSGLPLPFPDAMQEFKVETGALPAQYGSHSAAAVNAVTKSGTNNLHGTAFEFVRNYKFNARQFPATQIDSLKRNQFGGALGGAIIKNKLFYFGAYQQTATRQSPSGTIAFIPTPASLTGDFSVLNSLTCTKTPVALKDPFTGAILTNNRIPSNLIIPQALAIAKTLPKTADTACGKTTYGAPVKDDEHFGVGKVDFQISENHSIFMRYLSTHDFQPVPYDLAGGFAGGGNILTTGNGVACVCTSSTNGFDDLDQSLALGDTYVINSKMVNSFRGVFTRAAITKLGAEFYGPKDVGVNIYSAIPNFLNINVTGAFLIGNNLSTTSKLRTTFLHFSDDLGMVVGSHQLAFGASIGGWDSNVNGNVFAIGNFTFSGAVTGSALADFLTGRIGTFNQAAPNTQYVRSKIFGMYAQDSWKVKPGLTINYGIRWEPFFPLNVANSQISHFDINDFRAGKVSTVFKNAPAGMSFVGDAGFPGKSSMNNQWAQFMPRVGIAWDPRNDGKMSVRASYGMFYDRIPTEYHLNSTVGAPFGARTTIANPAGGLANPYQGIVGGNPFPYTLDPNNPFFNQFGTQNTFQYDTKMPYVQQWTVSLQRQIGKDWLATVSYLGNEITHLPGARGVNPGLILPCANGAALTVCNTLANINTRRLLNQLNPAQGKFFGPVTENTYGGTAGYNALMLSTQKRLSRGFTFTANYAWSHCISDIVNQQPNTDNIVYLDKGTNPKLDRGNCNLSGTDRRHIANMTAVAQMPKLSDKWVNMIVGGWKSSATVNMQSGSYVSVFTGVDRALNGFGNGIQRAQQILPNGKCENAGPSCWINPAAFAQPALGTIGNTALGIIEGPGAVTFNLGLSRLINVHEGQTVELRGEAQNVLNRINYNNPVNSLASAATFGQITSAQPARILQFGIKYVF